MNLHNRDVRILEFWVRDHDRICRVVFMSAFAKLSHLASATASAFALPATAIMFIIYWNAKPVFNHCVEYAINYKCNWNLVVLLLLESKTIAVKKFVFSESICVHVRKNVKNCVCYHFRKMLADAHPHLHIFVPQQLGPHC